MGNHEHCGLVLLCLVEQSVQHNLLGGVVDLRGWLVEKDQPALLSEQSIGKSEQLLLSLREISGN